MGSGPEVVSIGEKGGEGEIGGGHGNDLR